jgi:hypothetical protein
MNSFWYLNQSLYLANSGIPLFTQSVSYQFWLLIPIIAIETYTHRQILKLSIIKAIYISSVTNIFSTLVGGILVLLFGVFLGQIIFQTTVPVQPGDFPFLPLEIIVTLIPMFFISVFIELFIGRFQLKEIEKNKVKKSFLIANSLTYFMLVILAMTQLIKGYIEGRS